MAIPLAGSVAQAQRINQRIQSIDEFSEVEDGLQCFMDPTNFEVMDHNPQVLPCGHTFEANTIRNIQQQAERAIRERNAGRLATEPKCPSCRREIPPEYRPIPNINLKQAIETLGERVLPNLRAEQNRCADLNNRLADEQNQKTVYRDALAQDVQQIAGELVQRNARINTLEGEKRELQAERDTAQEERDAVRVENRTLTAQRNGALSKRDQANLERDQVKIERDQVKIELASRIVEDLSKDIAEIDSSISTKKAASFGSVVGSYVGMFPAAVAGAAVGGPVGFFAGMGASAFIGLGTADKIDESKRRAQEQKTQKEQEKLAIEAEIRNLRAHQRV